MLTEQVDKIPIAPYIYHVTDIQGVLKLKLGVSIIGAIINHLHSCLRVVSEGPSGIENSTLCCKILNIDKANIPLNFTILFRRYVNHELDGDDYFLELNDPRSLSYWEVMMNSFSSLRSFRFSGSISSAWYRKKWFALAYISPS